MPVDPIVYTSKSGSLYQRLPVPYTKSVVASTVEDVEPDSDKPPSSSFNGTVKDDMKPYGGPGGRRFKQQSTSGSSKASVHKAISVRGVQYLRPYLISWSMRQSDEHWKDFETPDDDLVNVKYADDIVFVKLPTQSDIRQGQSDEHWKDFETPDDDLVNVKYADDIVFVFEAERAQVFLDELTRVIHPFSMHFPPTKCKVMLVDM
ncbi:hypothetical protein T265_07047 [Opisthorchis viverrini]|uniref:Reverse transcriptase domain-containing protein n=1 Tax=Opisthorchis viverrini TaxID=6198 RepID=A0A075ACM8_OPIVI|nr:hypothetical protein T265_07047 [Opisthorchis viverrini]KER25534.1 hypothetical protein T265_07047 [Opisthorchis viverrini]